MLLIKSNFNFKNTTYMGGGGGGGGGRPLFQATNKQSLSQANEQRNAQT